MHGLSGATEYLLERREPRMSSVLSVHAFVRVNVPREVLRIRILEDGRQVSVTILLDRSFQGKISQYREFSLGEEIDKGVTSRHGFLIIDPTLDVWLVGVCVRNTETSHGSLAAQAHGNQCL